MSQPIRYSAKHPFTGDVRQSQLSFQKGSVITAKPNQQGAWWWGSCNGTEGWFPPAYVTAMPAQQPVPNAFGAPSQQQVSMQQRMQQASFAPAAVKQQQRAPAMQQQQGGLGGYPPQQQQQGGFQPSLGGYGATQGVANPYGVQQPSFGSQPPQQQFQQPAAADPFAAFDALTPTPVTGTGGVSVSSASSAAAGVGTQAGMGAGAITSGPPPLNVSQAQQQPPALSMSTPLSLSKPLDLSTLDAPQAKAAPAPSPPKKEMPSPEQLGMTSRKNTASSGILAATNESVKTDSSTKKEKSPSSKKSNGSKKSKEKSSKEPVLSKEEEAAKKAREMEQARLKEQMRKEKEELRKEQEATVSGIGASGVSLKQTISGDIEVGMGALAGGLEPTFNPYDFLAGTSGSLPTRKFSPIFRVPPFWAMMNMDTYVQKTPLTTEQMADRAAAYQQLAKALSFLCHVVAESEEATKRGIGRFAAFRSTGSTPRGPLHFLKHNHLACEACVKLISILPHSAGASGKALDGLFINFINVFVSLIENLQPNQQLVLPGGWQQPDYFHLCLYIVRAVGNDKFTFTVCNTGKDGLQYHPSTFDPETGKELKQLALTIWNIPSRRLMDSTFWTVLFRMQVYPHKRNTAEFLYTKLLPSLNSQPLRSNQDQGPAEFLEIPEPVSASTYHPLAKLALTSTPQNGMRSSRYSSLLLMNAGVDLAYAEIENAPAHSMDPEDTRILKLAGRNLAGFASTLDANKVGDGTLGTALSSTWDLLDKLHRKINFTASKQVDQYSHGLPKSALSDDFSKGTIKSLRTESGSAAHPFFGRLRRDDYDNVVKKLMGEPRPDPILIPAVITDEGLPPVATDFMTASSSLQRIADACSLLLQQRRLIKNAPAFAASAAQYAMTVVLPMPHSDPKYCFWRKEKMRRETQLNLLFLIRRLCRIYSASTACVQQSRGLVAIRSISFACAACVADAICRVKACDDPSTFALHYSGMCEGPTEPFAIEAGAFDTLGSNLPIYDPNLCSLRFRCLDYLRASTMNERGFKRKTIFNFDNMMTPLDGDTELINQLAINLALARPFPPTDEDVINYSASLISGTNGSIIEVLPEFEYFRDIVFHFKFAVSGQAQTASDVSDTKAWMPADATLHWKVKKMGKDDPRLFYAVNAFHGHPQEYVDKIAVAPSWENEFKGFMALFASKQKAVRARLSSADPNTVVNSCGDKFQERR